MTTFRSLLLAFVLVSLSQLAACGGGPELCSGTSCSCPANETCAFGAVTDSCRFDCATGATCTGTCAGSAVINCQGASCTHSAGAGSTVNCYGGTCNFTCTGNCIANCGSGCSLTCSGGTTQNGAGCS